MTRNLLQILRVYIHDLRNGLDAKSAFLVTIASRTTSNVFRNTALDGPNYIKIDFTIIIERLYEYLQ